MNTSQSCKYIANKKSRILLASSIGTQAQGSQTVLNQNGMEQDDLVKMWMDERANLLKKKDAEVYRLREKNVTLVQELKRLNNEIDSRLEHISFKVNKEERPEATENKLISELECLGKEAETMQIERKVLRKKLKVDSTCVRVVGLEKSLLKNIQRNQDIIKEIKDKQKKIQQDEKRLILLQTKGFIPPQIEEERLLKYLYKELDKSNTLEQRIEQDEENISLRQAKAKEINQEIFAVSRKLEELKAMAQEVAAQKQLDDPKPEKDEFEGKSVEELKEVFETLKELYEADSKIALKARKELENKIMSAQRRLKEVSYQKNTHSHEVVKLTRVIQLSRLKSIRHNKNAKSQSDMKLEEIKNRLKHQRKYKRMWLKPRSSAPEPESAEPSIDRHGTGDIFITQANKHQVL